MAQERSEESAADRLRLAVDLHDFGVQMFRQRLVREHPDWDSAQVASEVLAWLEGAPPLGIPSSADRIRRLTTGA